MKIFSVFYYNTAVLGACCSLVERGDDISPQVGTLGCRDLYSHIAENEVHPGMGSLYWHEYGTVVTTV